MPFSPAFLDELRRRTPLAELIGPRVKLARRGREHAGLCPFHREKTPSFYVIEDKRFWHCFGCGAHGDAIGFVMRAYGLDFQTAVEQLAGEAGLAVPSSATPLRSRPTITATRTQAEQMMNLVLRQRLIHTAATTAKRTRSR